MHRNVNLPVRTAAGHGHIAMRIVDGKARPRGQRLVNRLIGLALVAQQNRPAVTIAAQIVHQLLGMVAHHHPHGAKDR